MKRYLIIILCFFAGQSVYSQMIEEDKNEIVSSKSDTITFENKCLVFFHPTEQQYKDSLNKHSYYAEIESDFTYSILAVTDSLSKTSIKCMATDSNEIILINSGGQKYEFKRNQFKSLYGAIYVDGVNEPQIITKVFPSAFYFELIGK